MGSGGRPRGHRGFGAAVLLTRDGHDGATYDLTGPEAFSLAEAAEELTRFTGRRSGMCPRPTRRRTRHGHTTAPSTGRSPRLGLLLRGHRRRRARNGLGRRPHPHGAAGHEPVRLPEGQPGQLPPPPAGRWTPADGCGKRSPHPWAVRGGPGRVPVGLVRIAPGAAGADPPCPGRSGIRAVLTSVASTGRAQLLLRIRTTPLCTPGRVASLA